MFHGILFSVREHIVDRGTGCHRIASFLRENDWDIEVVDFVSQWTIDELKELVKSRLSSNTKFFGFSSFINFWPINLEIFTKWLKDTYPDIPIILGGQSILITNSNNIDIWIDSFGEIAILEILKNLTGNSTKTIAFENYKSKKVVRALHAYPSWKLTTFRNKFEHRDFMKPYEMVTIETSRGCKFACDFCNFPILGIKEDTSRSAEDLKEELIYNYNEFGIKNYTIADETFNDRIEKIRKYGDLVDTLNFKPWFMAFARADLMVTHESDWEYYRKMNLGGQYYGIETFNRDAGKIIGKGMDPTRLKEGLAKHRSFLNKNNVPYRGTISVICGLPKESSDSWDQTIEWLVANWHLQSVSAWFLEIPDINDQTSNKSKFTLNLEKYGIRRMTNLDFEIPDAYSFHKSLNKEYFWEHDLMNQLQAMQKLKDFHDQLHDTNFSCSGFSFTTGFVQYQTNNIEDIINEQFFNDNHENVKYFVKEYINQKLNWRP